MLIVEVAPRGFTKPKQCGFVKPHSVALKPHSVVSEDAQCGFEATLPGFKKPHCFGLVKPYGAASTPSMLPRLLSHILRVFIKPHQKMIYFENDTVLYMPTNMLSKNQYFSFILVVHIK